MIGPIIKLPSMIEDELRDKLTAELTAKYEAECEGMLAEYRTEIQRLQEENRRLMAEREQERLDIR